MKSFLKIAFLSFVFAGTAICLRAQMAAPPPMPADQPVSDAQLDQMLGPIALYPDPLIAQILPASTLPTQIVLADRYVTGGGDPNQIDQQPWDASVQALARYPNVLKWLDDNLNWTTELGQAFLNQQPAVMASIQRLRATANNLGNLQSTPQQQVITDGGDIQIVPVDPQVIYVPVYQPDQVYYDNANGSPFITFGIGWPIGAWLDYDCDWGNGNLIFWGNGYSRPANWWRESSRQRDLGHTAVWRPNNHPGAVAANRGDRGYGGNAISRSVSPAVIRQELARPAAPRDEHSINISGPAPARGGKVNDFGSERSPGIYRPAPAPVERQEPVSRPESSGAFMGIQSSQDTRAYSNRGQQSMQTIQRSAPVSRPAPSGGGGFSGGGGHGGGGGGVKR
jgi:uncharacterized membrane protein YgcG